MAKKLFLFVISIFLISAVFAQQTYNIDYYGVETTMVDKNLKTMTSDLYYTQLCEINSFSVTDKRDLVADLSDADDSIFEEGKLSFYTVIHQKQNSNKWVVTIHIYNKDASTEYTETKEYDSYYKILMESKTSLQETFISLVQNDKKNNIASASQTQSSAAKSSIAAISTSTENLAGTWQGEQNIEKIVIMRGGRGFVIFKNGASMNITIKVDDSSVIIAQTGKSNASFFPELPRSTALEAALNADPITWTLTLTSADTLTGTKQTLIPDGDSAKIGEIDVVWYRKL